MASSHLTRTLDATSGGGYSNKWTWSGWVKRSNLGELGIMGNQRTDNNINSRFKLYFRSTDKLGWECKDSGGSDDSSFETNMLFRDVNSWYHIVFIYDSDNSTESDRMKCYVNGKDVRTELGGFSSINEVGSGFGTLWSSSVVNYLGTSGNNSGNTDLQFDGYMSHCHLTYGHRYEASTFGESDSNGVWKIKTDPSVTYGSQGYFLLKNNGSVTDQSGEGNNYTATGTITNDKDSPSNVFATWNSLHNYYEGATYSNGNNTIVTGGNNTYTWNNSTLGMNKGKFYCEIKNVTAASSDNLIGITDRFTTSATHELGNFSTQWAYRMNGQIYNNNSQSSYGNSYAVGDIVGIAIDLDNNKLYFSKNGTWQNSGDPTSGSTGTGAISITAPASVQDGCYYFSFCGFSDQNESGSANFGNGRFGTTAVSSAGTNASGHGVFEYDVPTGYTALCTKGLNS